MPAALVLLLAVASIGLARSEEQEAELASVSKVCVEVSGNFELSFEVWDTANELLSRKSLSYASPGQLCLGLWALKGSASESQPERVCLESRGGSVLSVDLWGGANKLLSQKSLSYASPGRSCVEFQPSSSDQPAPEPEPDSNRSDNRSEPDGEWSDFEPEPELPSASRVCVENHAGFELSFDLWDTASNMVSSRSASYSSRGRACLDLWTLGRIQPGHPIVTVVHAASGLSKSLPPVLYSPASGGEGVTADFACSGSTGAFSCTLGGEKQEDQPGALVTSPGSLRTPLVRAKGVCVENSGGFALRVRLWDTATGALGAWSGRFSRDSSVCVDGGSLGGTSAGHPLVLIASPQGARAASFRSVIYDPDAATSAFFDCAGSTAEYDCRLWLQRRRL